MGRTYSRRQIERGLKRKGFATDFNDHRYLRFILDGERTHIRTFVQHGGGGRDVGVSLLKLMAIECYLSLPDFRNLVACPFTKEEYEQRYRDALVSERPPWHQGFRLLPANSPSALPRTSERLSKPSVNPHPPDPYPVMTPCELCDDTCDRQLLPTKMSDLVVCRSHGFSFYITLAGRHELESVRNTESAMATQRVLRRIVAAGKQEHAEGNLLRITSTFVRIMADRLVDD